jgi:hypothetical protein
MNQLISMTLEEQARQEIDAQFRTSGRAVQTKDTTNLSSSRGVAVCKLSFATGEPDCTLFAYNNLQRATRLRQSIPQKAFTGGLTS